MLPDALPQLLDSLLRLSHLDAPQLKELMQNLPDPEAAAQEMVCRGWITQGQFASLFPEPRERPAPRETPLLGCADDGSPSDTECEDWSLPLGEEEDKADLAPKVERAQPELADAQKQPNKVPGPWLGWASQGLLVWTLFLGSLFAGVQFFRANAALAPVAHQEAREADAGEPGKKAPLPSELPSVPTDNKKQRADLLKSAGQDAQPAAPVAFPPVAVSPAAANAPVTAKAPARPSDVKPKTTASLYARVRQIVLENKTEETERLGMGDIAYQDVPDDGSIMVGMAVTYAPFFTHQVIKSVQPIYQGPDGRRYDGPVCGTPTGIGERVIAKDGYAIGGAAIKSGMGIDGMQLTFMEIGADGLNTRTAYLSKWLGGYGGSGAKMFLNDGRPVVGIAGMWSKNAHSPAFCLGLVTVKAGTLVDADIPRHQSPPLTTRTAR